MASLPKALQRKQPDTPNVVQMVPQPQQSAAPAPAPAPAPASQPLELDISEFLAPGSTATQEPETPAAPAVPVAAPVPAAAPPTLATFDEVFGEPAPETPAPSPTQQNYADDIARLTQQVQQLSTTGGATPAANTSLMDIAVPEVAPELEAQYKDSSPYIQSLVAKAIKDHVAPAVNQLAERQATINTSVDELGNRVVQSGENSFRQNLRIAVPDIDQLTQDQAFVAHVSKPVEGTGGAVTIAQILAQNYRNKNIGAVRQIIDAYKATKVAAPGQEALVTPNAGPAPLPQTPVTMPPNMLALSKRKEASELWKRKQMSDEKFNKIREIYDQAFAEGRVDQNA